MCPAATDLVCTGYFNAMCIDQCSTCSTIHCCTLQGAFYARAGSKREAALLEWRPLQSLFPSDWTLELPAGERALAIAAGRGFVAVATSLHQLSIFTLSGEQCCFSLASWQRCLLVFLRCVVPLCPVKHLDVCIATLALQKRRPQMT